MADNKIVPYAQDDNWRAIVEEITNEVSQSDLPEKVVQATEFMLSGFTTAQTAKKVGVTTDTIKRWLTMYPTMTAAIAKSKKLLSQWRLSRLEQQFVDAVNVSEQILKINLDGTYTDEKGILSPVNAKVLTVLAAQARYVIGIFAGQKSDVTVTHELGQTVLKTQEDGLRYIADRLAEQQIQASTNDEPIEAVFRVISEGQDNTGPLLDENGNPPFGVMGVLEITEDGSVCHICGKAYKNLVSHINVKHSCTIDTYETLYLLEPGTLGGVGETWD